MKRLDFNIAINAPREKVWSVLWNDRTYRQWTSAFSPTSSAKTDWKKGSKALFLDGSDNGMVATIAENIPNEYMSIQHMAVLKDGREDAEIAKREGWTGAMENYILTAANGGTQLHIEVDTTERHQDFFKKTWPEALEKVKELAEA
jgi:uncharacterized protein YndB with AHSA1/START domain